MKILGIDWGEKKIGLSLSEGIIAEPYSVVHSQKEVEDIAKKESIEKIVVGISESESGEKSKSFGLELSEKLGVPVDFQDETLSTLDAQKFAMESGMKRKKRKALEDSYASAIMLQSYLDNV